MTTVQPRGAFPAGMVALLVLLGACASPTAAPSGASADLETRPYTARGNEPFWRLDVTASGVTLATPERTLASDGPAVTAPTPIVPGWRGFSARIGGEALMAEITPTVCQDSMSGQTYPDTVTVRFQEATLTGCGGDPMDLLVGSWRLEAIGDAPALTGANAATLVIGEDGRLSGSTGCNRMFGQLSVTGEGIAIAGMGMTRMACLDPGLMAQEQRVTQGLSGAQGFSIDDEGRLLLPTADQATLRWVRVSP